ncbi:MAG: Ger(x)C family spore germination protein [Clostridia bacterium]|nr:MAG: Ger(x)C family spore germination protein [Clostridia bacterium]
MEVSGRGNRLKTPGRKSGSSGFYLLAGAGKPSLVACLAALLLFLASGCWDRVEIEDRAFVLASGLDWAAPSPARESLEPAGYVGDRQYRLTIQVVEPAKMIGGQAGGGGGGGTTQEAPFWNVSTISGSIFAAIRNLATRVERVPDFSHMAVIVVGEELARRGMGDALDVFTRDNEVRRHASIYVAKGETTDVLKVKPKLASVNASYLHELFTNSFKTSRFPPRADMDYVESSMVTGRSFVLPRVVAGKQDVKLAGGAVFKGGRMVGWLGETEVAGYNWLANLVKGGELVVPCPWGSAVEVYEINTAKTRLLPLVEDGQVTFILVVKTEGTFAEHQDAHDALSPQYLRDFEAATGAAVNEHVQAALRRLQGLRADATGLGQALERRYPGYWSQVKERWEDEIFPTVELRVEPHIYVRRVGTQR